MAQRGKGVRPEDVNEAAAPGANFSLLARLAVLSTQRVIDLRSVCFDERAVWYKGEWWRLLTNFFFMYATQGSNPGLADPRQVCYSHV